MGKFNNPWDQQGNRRRKRLRQFSIGLAAFAVVFVGGMLLTPARPILIGAAGAVISSAVSGGEPFTCTVESVTDGDTFRCQEADENGRAIRVRLSGVAARETDGTCSPGHPCPDASAEAATAELTGLAMGWSLSCRKVGETYGRAAAFCERADGLDLSCAMVESGTVLKWRRHWGWHKCPKPG